MINICGYNVDDSKSHGKIQFKTTCPVCPERGKEHTKDTCLSVNLDHKVAHCHKCGWDAYFGEPRLVYDNVTYKLPANLNLTDLRLEHLQYFSGRGIHQETVIRNGIKSRNKDWYSFIYKEGNTIVNAKSRNITEKRFYQEKEAKQTMYKYNDIVCRDTIIVCEGEFDALSWEEAGYQYATSVSEGAPNINDKNIEKKLACVYNCFEIFENATTIYLSVDNDENGKRLQNELIRIFTADKCKIISFAGLIKGNGEPCKDANDVLLAYGKEKLIECYNAAEDVKADGIFDCNDFKQQILDDYKNGQPKGTTTYFPELDKCWTHRMGEVTIWSGYNNEGKSLFLKQLLLIKAKYEGWKFACFVPEDMPFSEWYTDIIESYIGLSADKTQSTYGNFMTEMQLQEGIKFVQEHFYAVYPKEKQGLDEILECFSYLVRKKNIKCCVIDPYNQIQHQMQNGEREDLYISRFMSVLKRFAVEHNVAVHLVAHQTTPKFEVGKDYPNQTFTRLKVEELLLTRPIIFVPFGENTETPMLRITM